jgi:hypothetical protein
MDDPPELKRLLHLSSPMRCPVQMTQDLKKVWYNINKKLTVTLMI